MESEKILKEELNELESKRKAIKERYSAVKKARLRVEAKEKKEGELKIRNIPIILKKIQQEIFAYNKMGKRAKYRTNILQTISKLAEIDPLFLTQNELNWRLNNGEWRSCWEKCNFAWK